MTWLQGEAPIALRNTTMHERGPRRARYTVDLGATAAQADRAEVAARFGRSIVAPVWSWLLWPEPFPDDAVLELRLTAPPKRRIVTALPRIGDGLYRVRKGDVSEAGYAAFGELDVEVISLPARLGGDATAQLDVVFLDARYGLPKPVLLEWIRTRALAVSDFWGGFPVRRALLVLVPGPDRTGVVFGRVLSVAGPAVVVFLGKPLRPEHLQRDWLLVHELFHLGFPNVGPGSRWLTEGLATYFEPIIQARAGWRSEEALWAELADGLPRAKPAVDSRGLARASDFGSIYWGGALVCLLADIEVRRRTGGRRGLEHALVGLLDDGVDPNLHLPIGEAVAALDKHLGAPILAGVIARHVETGTPFDLDALLKRLGVVRGKKGRWVLDDRAVDAATRRALLHGPPSEQVPPRGRPR